VTKGRLAAQVRRWQKLFRLQEWNLETDVVERAELEPKHSVGNVIYNVRGRTAMIAGAREDGGDGAERIALHEMLHLTLADLVDFATQLTDHLSPDAQCLAEDAISHEAERVVQRLERGIMDALGERR